MKFTRRSYLFGGALAAGSALLDRLGALAGGRVQADTGEHVHPAATVPSAPGAHGPEHLPYTPVVTPNGSTLPWTMKNGVKEFHLIAEPVAREFAPGMVVNCWGYNGQTPGPTIEAVEGDRVRILVTNKLPEHTSIHWHGVFLPNGMDGVGGLTQPQLRPGETYVYEFTLRQHGTYMYHPHADETVQMAMGMMGFFIIHPRTPAQPAVERDFAIFPHEWFVEPGTSVPNPNIMTDFNIFTFNSRAFPGTAPLVARRGQRVRLRFGNLSMDSHPIHIHGHRFWIVETDGGQIPRSAWWPETTVNIPPGTTRAVEFVADAPGDWVLHCHKPHHAMNAMNHNIPNVMGIDRKAVEQSIGGLVPGYIAMGSDGMAEHATHAEHLKGVPNTLPMMAGAGPFGNIEMGGMFTLVKIRDGISSYADPGWYDHPKGSVAWKLDGPPEDTPARPEHVHHHDDD